MTTSSFPADAVNLCVGTVAAVITRPMFIRMVTAKYYTTGLRMVPGTIYYVPSTWGEAAVTAGWAIRVTPASIPLDTPNSSNFLSPFAKSAVAQIANRGLGETLRNFSAAGAPAFNWGGAAVAPSEYVVGNGATVSSETRRGRPVFKITTLPGVTTDIDLLLADTAYYARLNFQVEGDRTTGVSNYFLLVTGDTFTNYAQVSFSPATAPINASTSPGPVHTWTAVGQLPGAALNQELAGIGPAWGTTNPALDGTTTINRVRVRITPLAGQVATTYIYGISFAPARRVGRVFVTLDDGYKSAINLLYPILQARNIPITLDLITTQVGNTTTGYLTWADAQQIVASGGQVVAHGPVLANANSNLIAQYATNAERIADMSAARQMIADNGCASPGFDKVYVWPQGSFQSATGDSSLLDAAIDAGFTVGRAANGSSAVRFDFSTASRYQRLTLPIIGHVYAFGAEAANITAINAAITGAGSTGTDCILIFHQGVKNADTPTELAIRSSDFITIADNIVTEVNAGRLRACIMGDLAHDSVWSSGTAL